MFFLGIGGRKECCGWTSMSSRLELLQCPLLLVCISAYKICRCSQKLPTTCKNELTEKICWYLSRVHSSCLFLCIGKDFYCPLPKKTTPFLRSETKLYCLPKVNIAMRDVTRFSILVLEQCFSCSFTWCVEFLFDSSIWKSHCTCCSIFFQKLEDASVEEVKYSHWSEERQADHENS